MTLLRPFRAVARAFRATRRTVVAVPDAMEAILVLPTVARRLEAVAFQTATLDDLRKLLEEVQRNTSALPRMDDRLMGVHESLARVDANTRAVEQLVEVALPLQGAAVRLGRFSDRLPRRRVIEG